MTHTPVMDELENLMMHERSQRESLQIAFLYLHEISRIDSFLETESRLSAIQVIEGM